MNGISYEDYKDFLKNWTLVTIRFRKDTGEMRLTYANQIALETLKNDGVSFKPGAVLAKTGIATTSDINFSSSLIPQYIRRIQLMVYDKNKFKQTDGWGYALFDQHGKTFPEDPVLMQESCHACHELVKDQGYVFSRPFSFTAPRAFIQVKLDSSKKISFIDKKYSELPKNIQSYIDSNYKITSLLVFKELSKKLFQGALDELKPMLEIEALQKKRPAVFLSENNKRFVIVKPVEIAGCSSNSGVEIMMTNLKNEINKESVCLND